MKTKIQNNCFLIHYNVMIYENRTQFVVAIYTYIYYFVFDECIYCCSAV